MSTNPQLDIFHRLRDIEKKQYISILQGYLDELIPTKHLVGPDGSYDPEHLFVNIEKISEIESQIINYIRIYNRFNNDPRIRLLISNIQQVILAYYSLINNTARELNIKIFNMPWNKIISGKIDLTNPEINSSNPFTVSSITAGRTLGGRTKKRRNKRRRTLRRIRRHYK